jgi:hypothetical protein
MNNFTGAIPVQGGTTRFTLKQRSHQNFWITAKQKVRAGMCCFVSTTTPMLVRKHNSYTVINIVLLIFM